MAPELQRHGVGMLALSVTPEPQAVRSAAARLGLHLPVAYTAAETLGPNGLRGVPSMLFVDAQGTVVDGRNGRQSASSVYQRALELAR